MAVIDHPVHERVRIGSDSRYGCHNREAFSQSYCAPDRTYFPDGTFEQISVRIFHVMSQECRYDMSLTDSACTNCKWRGTGEEYNEMVRRLACKTK